MKRKKLQKKYFLFKSRQGAILITTLVFTFIFIVMSTALLGNIVAQYKAGVQRVARTNALQIAEAGINYYKWHLDNFTDDYADGTAQTGCNPCGPYIHDYEDPNSSIIGKFELYITPPKIGSTIVKIKSTGWTIDSPKNKRYLAVRYGRSSWAQFAVVANAAMRFGAGTIVHGPIHANGGIRFDGVAYNEATSGATTYNDADSDACTVNSWGVHTCVAPPDPTPPTNPPDRQDVFIGGRRYPVPNVDFDSISVDLSQLTIDANADGVYLNPSNKQGYHIQFLGSSQFQYRTVKTTSTCTWSGGTQSASMGDINQYQGNWTTANLPNNGIIFVEDNAWIDGTINGKFITIIAAKEPLATGLADVWINNDILYSAKDGTSGLGIIAQNNISVGLFSEDDLEVDAALLAQKGRVGRFYYPSDCNATYYKRSAISVYGSIATYKRYGFSWNCAGVYCSGYQTRNLDYDKNLIYSPPPSFPTSGEYTFIKWDELLPGESY